MIELLRVCEDQEYACKLYQWDLERQVKVTTTEEITEVHFARIGDSEALIVEAKKHEDGYFLADIPNIHLQEAKTIIAYVVKEDVTLEMHTFKVLKREKPADYVYTETEIKSFKTIMSYVYDKEFCYSEEKSTGNFTTEQSKEYYKYLTFELPRIPVEAKFIVTVCAWCTVLHKSIIFEQDAHKLRVELKIGGLGNTDQANVSGFVMYRSSKDKDEEAFEAFKTFLDEINEAVV